MSYINTERAKKKFWVLVRVFAVSSAVPVLLSFLIVSWYFMYQNGLRTNVGDGLFSVLWDGTYRTFSHIDFEHLKSNTSFLIIIGTLIGMFRRNLTFLIDAVLITMCSSILFALHFETVVGFSFVAYGILGVAIVCVGDVTYSLYNKNKGFGRSSLSLIIPAVFLLIITLPSVIYDLMVVSKLVEIGDIKILGFVVKDIPKHYTEISSMAHIHGLISGLIISILTDLFNHIFCIRSYKQYFLKIRN